LSKLSKALRDRLWALSRPRIDRLHYTGGGLGDELMFTAVVAEARRTGRPLHVLTDKPEVWEGNTDPASVQTGIEKWFRAKDRGRLATEIVHLSCSNSIHVHLADQMAKMAGVELPPNWAPVYHTRRPAGVEEGSIVIQNSCRGALYAATTKEWPFDRWDCLAERLLAEGHRLVQIGTSEDPLVPGVVDLRGGTDLARAAAILEQAKLFIGLESGLMHLAASVRVPTVIIYGGRTRPWETGYPWHWHAANLSIPCVGCALNTGCPHDVACMKEIGVDSVWIRVQDCLAGRTPPGFGSTVDDKLRL
jgi:hypothetical protein